VGSSPTNVDSIHKKSDCLKKINSKIATIIAYFNICANIQLIFMDLLFLLRQNSQNFSPYF